MFRILTFVGRRLDRLASHINSGRLQSVACSMQLRAYDYQGGSQ